MLLDKSDYTSTSGTSVVLDTGASADDVVVIIVYDVFSVADTVSKSDTFDGNITGTFDGNIHYCDIIFCYSKHIYYKVQLLSNFDVILILYLKAQILPSADDTHDLGSSSKQWRDIYTGDINLNNTKTRDNEVDGTRGSWTIQEGADDLFLLNRLNGKKYKFKLEEM